MKQVKDTFVTSAEKNMLRHRMLPHGHTLIGLGGPDIEKYVDTARKKGFKDIRVWENNPIVYMKTLPRIKGLNIQYNIEDIIKAPFNKSYIYDLDFCCRIESVGPYLKKFTHNFILTVSEMYLKPFASLPIFAKHKEEKIKRIIATSDNDRIVMTDKGVYAAYRYNDTSPMLIIKPFPINN